RNFELNIELRYWGRDHVFKFSRSMLKQLKSNAVHEGTPHTAKFGVRKGAPGSYIIKYKCTLTNTIGSVLRNRGWQEVSREDECEFYWCEPMAMKELFDHGLPNCLMKVCHFRNHHELTRKNLMVKNLKRFKKKYEKDYGKLEAQKIEFIPTTFELPVTELFNRIDMIFVISLLSVQKIMIQDKRCFELYGYDILIDNELKPWLLEINASPSLTASSKEDYILKCSLLDDMLDVVDLEGRLVGDEKRVGDFDLVWDDGPVSPTNRTTAGWIAEAMAVLKPSPNDNTTGSSGSGPFVLRPGGFPKLNSYLGCISSKPDSIKTRQKRSSAESKPTLVAQT
ncbi:hypothetical protein CRM22_000658, partial [Opisthorchis felineus]